MIQINMLAGWKIAGNLRCHPKNRLFLPLKVGNYIHFQPKNLGESQVYPEWLNISAVKDDQGRPTHYVGAFSDISTHKSDEEARLYRLAYYDTLTGLLNRAGFIGHGKIRLAHTQNYGHGFALFFIDLDHFKTINNSLGHAIGDLLLKAVAARLQHDFYPNDLVAHFGYDKFIVTLDTVRHPEDLAEAVQKLMQCLALPFQIDGQDLFISASVGVSYYPVDAQDIETLLKHAEIAMYLTKNNGRNGYQLYREEMNLGFRLNFSRTFNISTLNDRKMTLNIYNRNIMIQINMLAGWKIAGNLRCHPKNRLFLPLKVGNYIHFQPKNLGESQDE